MSATLLPCPLCGQQPERNGRSSFAGGVVCRKGHLVQVYGKSQEEADAKWNTRAGQGPGAWVPAEHLVQANDRLAAALRDEATDVEVEDALTSEGILVWGPDGERFERMFKRVMALRAAEAKA